MALIIQILIRGGGFFQNPVVAALFEGEGEFLAAGPDDLAVHQDMDEVGHDVIEEPLVMSDDESGVVRAAQFVDTGGDDFQGVNVQAGIGFIEDGEPGFEDGHLEDFVALFFAAGKALVDGAIEQGGVEVEDFASLLDELEELDGGQLGLPAGLAAFVEGGAKKVSAVDAGNFHRILEGEEDSGAGAILGLHGQEVGALEEDGAGGDLVFAAAGEDLGEGAFAAAVGTHDGVDLAHLEREVEVLENGLAIHARRQIANV